MSVRNENQTLRQDNLNSTSSAQLGPTVGGNRHFPDLCVFLFIKSKLYTQSFQLGIIILPVPEV